MARSLRRLETIKKVRDHLEPWLRAGDMQDYLACMAGDPSANAHHAPHDRLGSAAVGFFQSQHPSHNQVHGGYPKHVVDQHAQAQEGGIHGKLARRQAFHVHLGLEFPVMLLAGAPLAIQFQSLVGIKFQVGPQNADSDLWT